MKLSDAIVMGYSEIEHTNERWLEPTTNGQCRGCAIGAALFAMGQRDAVYADVEQRLAKFWPWAATEDFGSEMTSRYWEVLNGHASIDDLVAWVRSQEPLEEQPILVPQEAGEAVHAT
jgi:hypothetical protein